MAQSNAPDPIAAKWWSMNAQQRQAVMSKMNPWQKLGLAKRLGYKPSAVPAPTETVAPTQQTKPPSPGAGSVMGDLGMGALKSFANPITMGAKAASMLPGAVGKAIAPLAAASKSIDQPSNTTQYIGQMLGTAGQLAIPTGMGAKAASEAAKGASEAGEAESLFKEASGLRKAAVNLENGILSNKGEKALNMYRKGQLGKLLDATTAEDIKAAMGDHKTLTALQDMVHQGVIGQKEIAPLVHAALTHPEVASNLAKWALGTTKWGSLGIGGMITYIYHRTIFDMIMRAFRE